MKKLILFTIVIMMTLTAYGTTGIQVQKPGAGHIIYHGSTNDYMIKWIVTGNIHEFVKIRLYDKTGNTQIYKITDKTPSKNGQFPWCKSLINNTNYGEYVIRVRTIDNLHSDDSGVFHVKKKQNLVINTPKISKAPVIKASDLKGIIKVTSPVENHSYEINKPMFITWDKNIGNYTRVNIYLCSETDNSGKKLFTLTANDGQVQWTPPENSLTWPGNKPYIKIFTDDNLFSGESGLFNIVPPAQPKKKTIARTPVINNKYTHNCNMSDNQDCLTAPTPGVPGRAANSNELKTGHHVSQGTHKKCSWVLTCTFTGDMTFDLSKIKGKEIVRAELLISLSDHIEVLAPTSNATCSSQSRVFDGNWLVNTFHIFTPGNNAKIDVLKSVKSWAASDKSTYTLTIKDNKDVVNLISVCLKYYSQPILFVDYME